MVFSLIIGYQSIVSITLKYKIDHMFSFFITLVCFELCLIFICILKWVFEFHTVFEFVFQRVYQLID